MSVINCALCGKRIEGEAEKFEANETIPRLPDEIYVCQTCIDNNEGIKQVGRIIDCYDNWEMMRKNIRGNKHA